MEKEEALNGYKEGLEKSLIHPALLADRKLKDLVKYLLIGAFECGWDSSNFYTLSREEQEAMLEVYRAKVARSKDPEEYKNHI